MNMSSHIHTSKTMSVKSTNFILYKSLHIDLLKPNFTKKKCLSSSCEIGISKNSYEMKTTRTKRKSYLYLYILRQTALQFNY